MRSSLYIVLLSILLLSCDNDQTSALYSSNKADIKAYNLVDPLEAQQLLTSEPNKFVPIQVSKASIFKKEHIPNALNLWRPDYGEDSDNPVTGLRASPTKIEQLLQQVGFKEGQTLLLYDTKANVDACRLAWVFNLYGFDDFKIINGGLVYWKKLGLPTTNKETTLPDVSGYRLDNLTTFDSLLHCDFKEVNKAINERETVIVDTREEHEYRGLPFIYKGKIEPYKNGAYKEGSIPTSVHLNWSTLADLNGDHRIKSERDLRYDLESRGITPDKNIILYCHSGSRTSHTYYILKHVLKYPFVKNYDGSWIEWSYRYTQDNSVPYQSLHTESEYNTILDSLTKQLTQNG